MNEAAKKREQTLEKKYGGKAALAEKRREWQAKSRLKYKGTGGLKSMSLKRRKEISKLGNDARWKNNEKKNAKTEGQG